MFWFLLFVLVAVMLVEFDILDTNTEKDPNLSVDQVIGCRCSSNENTLGQANEGMDAIASN